MLHQNYLLYEYPLSAYEHTIISCILKKCLLDIKTPFSCSPISLFYFTEKKFFLELPILLPSFLSSHFLLNPPQSDFALLSAPPNLSRSSVIWHSWFQWSTLASSWMIYQLHVAEQVSSLDTFILWSQLITSSFLTYFFPTRFPGHHILDFPPQ